MRKRTQKVFALWVGCALLGGCTALNMEPPGEDMQTEDSGTAADASLPPDLSVPPLPDLQTPPFDLTSAVADMTQTTTDAGSPGSLTLQGGFVGGGFTGGQGGYQLRGQFLWHGAISGSNGGYTLSGWLL
ncbi:MAG TPA: hypothetical protein VH877_23280 [Polyangia bacterium]|jgi:hypothetical protein|nr:hypothetical protein [Polyangia bacterium]